jgi:hypothetical protein
MKCFDVDITGFMTELVTFYISNEDIGRELMFSYQRFTCAIATCRYQPRQQNTSGK